MRARLVTFVLFASLGILGASIAAQERQGASPATSKKNPVAASAESLATGETLFRRRCAGCHGVDAKGGPPKDNGDPAASNLIDDKWDHGGTDGEIYAIIREGLGPDYRMEAFADRLSDAETWHIINYVRSLAKK